MSKFSTAVRAKARRSKVMEALAAQLIKGTKPEKVDGRTTNVKVPLTEKDVYRIQNQIAVLKTRI